MSRQGFKGTKYNEPFVGVMRSVFNAPAFWRLSPYACKLLFDLMGQYRGDNNGDLNVAWSVVKKRGWRSRTTLWRCKTELIDAGFIYVTRKGHMPSTCELLALTWFPLDPSPKFDPEALACFKSKAYVKKDVPPLSTQKPKRDWTLPNGGREEAFKIKGLVHLGNIDEAASPLMKH